MPLLDESVAEKKLDVRMIERNLTRGVIAPKELEDAAKRLPDDSENAEWVNLETLAADDSESNGSSH